MRLCAQPSFSDPPVTVESSQGGLALKGAAAGKWGVVTQRF